MESTGAPGMQFLVYLLLLPVFCLVGVGCNAPLIVIRYSRIIVISAMAAASWL
jgi:hypothetical protein